MAVTEKQKAKKLRSGFTTGTCATIAAKAAATMLFTHEVRQSEWVITTNGTRIEVAVEEVVWKANEVSCCVTKDAGDDPDVTNGIKVYAAVSLSDKPGIDIDGGIGVGRVTKPGLWQAIGEAAINKVPRSMIKEAVSEVLERFGYVGGAKVMISIPEGVALAKKTFNPRLGIVGGISVLGTSGIVKPMSEQALIDTILVEMKVLQASGNSYLLITPGNYGSDFIEETLKLNLNQAVRCSNFVGEAISFAQELGIKGVLLVGHVGKFIKLAAGIMNTHSKKADGRMEIIAAHAALEGASLETLQSVMNAITTDEAITCLKQAGIAAGTMKRITERMDFYMRERAGDDLEIGVIFFSNVHGILGKTQQVDQLLKHFK